MYTPWVSVPHNSSPCLRVRSGGSIQWEDHSSIIKEMEFDPKRGLTRIIAQSLGIVEHLSDRD